MHSAVVLLSWPVLCEDLTKFDDLLPQVSSLNFLGGDAITKPFNHNTDARFLPKQSDLNRVVYFLSHCLLYQTERSWNKNNEGIVEKCWLCEMTFVVMSVL